MFKVTPISIIEHNANYAWLIEHAGKVAVVDPGDAGPIIEYCQQHQLHVDYLLITHKHWDHVNGILDMKAAFPHAQVYGTGHAQIPGMDHPIMGGEGLELMGLSWKTWHTPGHTLDHIVFYTQVADQQGNQQGHLFSGDNLFACGCGRMFEGTAEQFYASLQSIASLPDDTIIYATHEYTLANIRFARHVDPKNPNLIARQEECTKLREQGLPTLPTTVYQERQSNPFVRCDQTDIIQAAEDACGRTLSKPEDVFAVIRDMKDRF